MICFIELCLSAKNIPCFYLKFEILKLKKYVEDLVGQQKQVLIKKNTSFLKWVKF